MVVIALMVVLSSFSISWIKGAIQKHRIESDFDRIYAFLNAMRFKAFSQKVECNLEISEHQIVARCENSTAFITVKTPIQSSRVRSTFTHTGFINHVFTICPKVPASEAPRFSCIKVSRTRIMKGIWKGTDSDSPCNDRTCTFQ